MRERPILFRAPMVRAILDGRKSQTRRKMLDQPCILPDFNRGHLSIRVRGGVYQAFSPKFPPVRCPYGQPGDRLWVREAWRIGAWNEDAGVFAIDYCDGPLKEWRIPFATATEEPHEVFERMWIDCCDELDAKRVHHDGEGRYKWEPGQSPLRWHPSIHMPRWASRITLEITGVRVERLQDISEADAKAEGAEHNGPCDHARHSCADIGCWGPNSYRGGYAELWESINGAGSWAANPWIWVVEFKRVIP